MSTSASLHPRVTRGASEAPVLGHCPSARGRRGGHQPPSAPQPIGAHAVGCWQANTLCGFRTVGSLELGVLLLQSGSREPRLGVRIQKLRGGYGFVIPSSCSPTPAACGGPAGACSERLSAFVLRGPHVLEDQQVPAVTRVLEYEQSSGLLPVLLQLRLGGEASEVPEGPRRLLRWPMSPCRHSGTLPRVLLAAGSPVAQTVLE